MIHWTGGSPSVTTQRRNDTISTTRVGNRNPAWIYSGAPPGEHRPDTPGVFDASRIKRIVVGVTENGGGNTALIQRLHGGTMSIHTHPPDLAARTSPDRGPRQLDLRTRRQTLARRVVRPVRNISEVTTDLRIGLSHFDATFSDASRPILRLPLQDHAPITNKNPNSRTWANRPGIFGLQGFQGPSTATFVA